MRIKWLKAAMADLEAIADYIAQDNPKAADRLLDRIRQSVAHLEHSADLGREGRVPGTRELIVPHTSYVVPYVIRDGAVEILAVMHGARIWPKTF
jgi:addiction module RelE/StbE family toxin